MGPRTRRFEAALAEWTGAPHAVAVSSGTAALHLAARALELGPGDEVIVPAFTFLATAHASATWAPQPVLCDVVSPGRPTLDVGRRRAPHRAAHARGHRRAPVRVHGGSRSRAPSCATARGLALVEDAAQASGPSLRPGRQAGTAGRLGCLSFFSKKQLCVGEGGWSSPPTRSSRRACAPALPRDDVGHVGPPRGHAASYDVVDLGYNYRLDEPRAALGMSRLPRLRTTSAPSRRGPRATAPRWRTLRGSR